MVVKNTQKEVSGQNKRRNAREGTGIYADWDS